MMGNAMRTIALIVQKGGTGKTTLAVCLATAAALAGLTTVIIDLDPQATACNWSDRRKTTLPDAPGPAVIDVQPARLLAALADLENKNVDLVIIDTPPRSEQSALAAAKIADLVLIPCRPQAYDLETIASTQEILKFAEYPRAIAVLNAVPWIGTRHEQAARYLEKHGLPVCPRTIGSRAVFGDAAALGKTPQEIDPKGKGAFEVQQLYKYVSQVLDKLTTQQHEVSHVAKTRSGRAG
jgi:chromosome partitioning protein